MPWKIKLIHIKLPMILSFDKAQPVYIGSDHAGFEYKEAIRRHLAHNGYTVADKGTYSTDSADYPDYAHAVATAVAAGNGATAGILICGSGNGVCMTANKHAGVRAGLCWSEELTALTRQHNNANILCVPARFIPLETAQAMATTFLTTDFEGGRHQRRAEKIELAG